MTLPHRRRNLLTGEWVLVSPHRAERPWQGAQEAVAPASLSPFDPDCYLCPGVARVGGAVNPPYTGVYVFDNDFPALLGESAGSSGFFESAPVTGRCRVICYSPRHDLTLGQLDSSARLQVVRTWMDEYARLGEEFAWVQIFENKGEMMGCSNPHPHGQVWAVSDLPTLPAREQASFLAWSGEGDLLGRVMDEELSADERIFAANDEWVWWVPFWAAWPFETLLAPRPFTSRMDEMSTAQQEGLADILGVGLNAMDRLFGVSFPYSMGWHAAPTDGQDHPEWRLHAHYYPPLLRSATVKKYMVGYEMLAETQRDITPEAAAQRLRECL